jgi:hypothetical protein
VFVGLLSDVGESQIGVWAKFVAFLLWEEVCGR